MHPLGMIPYTLWITQQKGDTKKTQSVWLLKLETLGALNIKAISPLIL